MRDITLGYQYRNRPGDRSLDQRAVVVLNACGSSYVDPRTAGSFPRWFVANGHRAFVGTQINVPNSLAAEWARRMYEALLGEPPRTLGEANVVAGRGLLDDWKNPLGLVYAVYGEPELSIAAEPVPAELEPRTLAGAGEGSPG
jgi:hypothetical protein